MRKKKWGSGVIAIGDLIGDGPRNKEKKCRKIWKKKKEKKKEVSIYLYSLCV